MSEPLLTISDLSFSFGKKPVLADLNLQIGSGEMILFAGANGAGKTTLLNLIAGILPAPGKSQIQRLAAGKLAHIDTELSMYKTMKAQEAERLHRAMFAAGPLDWAALHEIGIGPRQRLGELSRGQKALFRLHLALSQEPQLLLIDEVLVSLDPLFQERMGRLLVDVCARGGSVIATSQTPGEWQHLYSRLWLLKGQHMIINEPMEQLLGLAGIEYCEQPSHPDWPILDESHEQGLHKIVYYPLPKECSACGLQPVSLQQFIKSILGSQTC